MTKLKILAKPLKSAIAAVSKALPRNSPNEVWNHVIVDVRRDSPNLCHAISGRVAASAPIGEIETSVDGMAGDGLFLLPDSCMKTIALTEDEDTLEIQHESATHTKKRYTDDLGKTFVIESYDLVKIKANHGLYSLDVKTLPVFAPATVDFTDCLEFQPDHVADMIAKLGDIHDDAEYQVNFTGVHLASLNSTWATATATDGRRIGIAGIPCAMQGLGVARLPGQPDAVVPRCLLKLVNPQLDKCGSTIRVTFDDRRCAVAVGDVVYQAALQETRFPSTERGVAMLREQGTKVGRIAVETLRYGLSLAKITTCRRLDAPGVRITGVKGKLLFESQAPDTGKCHVVHDGGVENPFYIMIDPSYLIPILSAIRETFVDLLVIDDHHLMIDAPDFRYILAGINKNQSPQEE